MWGAYGHISPHPLRVPFKSKLRRKSHLQNFWFAMPFFFVPCTETSVPYMGYKPCIRCNWQTIPNHTCSSFGVITFSETSTLHMNAQTVAYCNANEAGGFSKTCQNGCEKLPLSPCKFYRYPSSYNDVSPMWPWFWECENSHVQWCTAVQGKHAVGQDTDCLSHYHSNWNTGCLLSRKVHKNKPQKNLLQTNLFIKTTTTKSDTLTVHCPCIRNSFKT